MHAQEPTKKHPKGGRTWWSLHCLNDSFEREYLERPAVRTWGRRHMHGIPPKNTQIGTIFGGQLPEEATRDKGAGESLGADLRTTKNLPSLVNIWWSGCRPHTDDGLTR